ncbi:MAG: EthD family reductase [Rhodobacter sp.]|nr:EthD family reductase [Paracoccaceae bacterium]MCC0076279.1 EthD family reductase [Rhodobacter sp.]
MITRFGLLRRDPVLTRDQFDAHWRHAHGPLAAQFPGLRAYNQHRVVNDAQFGIDHGRGPWQLDGFSELRFDDLHAMKSAVASPAFGAALTDERGFLGDVHLVACERHEVVPVSLGDGPFVKRMTLLKRLPGLTSEAFRHEWLTVHAQWVRQWPDVLGYVQNLVIDRWHDSREDSAPYEAVPVDGIVEFWFRDTETAARLYASDVVARTQQHARVFLDEITPFFVETRRIV